MTDDDVEQRFIECRRLFPFCSAGDAQVMFGPPKDQDIDSSRACFI